MVKTEYRLWNQSVFVQIPAVSLASCVTWGKVLNFSVPGFPYLENVDNNTTDLGYQGYCED